MTHLSPSRVFLVVLLLSGIMSSSQQRIDCRRFVYAPICRGVAAKRSEGGADVRFLHNSISDRKTAGEVEAAALELLQEAAPAPTPGSGDVNPVADVIRPESRSSILESLPGTLYRLYLSRLPHKPPPTMEYDY